ncbi:biotin-dependent carboxyltransferase family protein [Cellulomonas sp. URHE0023]|uniref:5-oxoprolinase subunit C family protein n=1 Tax=Cellulomonas sp. URHE0023 TaxID=1380354 RepID=UPI000480ACEE|nr:biotin-dependent carboxyltransferase family protein [Cellulomonas sp. URHE0023]
MIRVLDPGVLTLVQDLGRPGWAHIGVGRSGAADAGSLRLGNRLVANDTGAAGLEVLLGGLRFQVTVPTTVAVTGAPGPVWVDGTPVAHNAVLELAAGAELRVGTSPVGLRSYVAVRGGIDVPSVLGSRSTDQLAGIGPEPVGAGDVLPVGPAPDEWPVVDLAVTGGWPTDVVLPVLPGPQADWFDHGLVVLSSGDYVVTPATNRVALRLDGSAVARPEHRELPSAGLVPGAVQIPPDAQPVVFGVDHPVTGGYPVLAVVRRRALDSLGQVRPGDRVRFVLG